MIADLTKHSMHNLDYILSLCQDLAAQGKTPSVALIKSRAQKPLPLADILAVLQRWKQSPQQAREVSQMTPSPPPPLEQRVARLEKQLGQVLSELKALRAQQPGS